MGKLEMAAHNLTLLFMEIHLKDDVYSNKTSPNELATDYLDIYEKFLNELTGK